MPMPKTYVIILIIVLNISFLFMKINSDIFKIARFLNSKTAIVYLLKYDFNENVNNWKE